MARQVQRIEVMSERIARLDRLRLRRSEKGHNKHETTSQVLRTGIANRQRKIERQTNLALETYRLEHNGI